MWHDMIFGAWINPVYDALTEAYGRRRIKRRVTKHVGLIDDRIASERHETTD